MAVSKGTARRVTVAAAAEGAPPTRASKASSTAVGPVSGSSDRVAPGLVGARIRARRLARNISLRQFARGLDVSASFISQLETGKAQPSVATLFAICDALGIATDELFDNESPTRRSTTNGANGEVTDADNNAWRKDFGGEGSPTSPRSATADAAPQALSPLVHPDERRVLVLDSGVTWESLTATRNGKTEFMFVRYDVGGSSTTEGRLIRHVGSEYGYVISGTLRVTVGFETYRLDAGDSISFDSSRPHRLANVGDVPVEAIWFNLEMLTSE